MEELALIFHGVGEAPADVDPDERRYWMPEDAFLRLVAALPAVSQATGTPIVATFDDGNRSDIEIAAPALRRHGVPGKFYVCSARLGRPGYLDGADIRSLAQDGFEVGSHGARHRPWRGLDDATLAEEVDGARAALAAALGRPITSAALPFGAYDRRVLAALRRAGFDVVYSSDPGIARRDRWFRRRWCWVAGEDFDPAALIHRSRRPGFRAVSALKGLLKAWR